MTNEELLIPRFRVLADYPFSAFPVDAIITLNKKPFHEFNSKKVLLIGLIEFEKYPHLFQKINWWWKRKDEEIPKFLKFVWEGKTDEVRQVKEWLYADESEKWKPIEKREAPHEICGFLHQSDFTDDCFPRVSINGWLPATEEEFNEFIKTHTLKTR